MQVPNQPDPPIISPDGRFYWTSTGWAALPSAAPTAAGRDRSGEQPYEKALNDATGAAAFVASGWAFWGGWLGSYFASLMILSTIFGDLHGAVYWVLFFATLPVGAWAGNGFSDYTRGGAPT